MFFSPISERSLRVRLLYGTLYLLLALGAVTMVVPFLIMLTGSVEQKSDAGGFQIFPAYLVDEDALWERYVETKYHGLGDLLRMAWNEPSASFRDARRFLVAENSDADSVRLWREFRSEVALDEKLFCVGWLRPNTRMPAFANRLFQSWLLNKYGSLEGINAGLATSFDRLSRIQAPRVRIDGSPLPQTPLVRDFLEFSATLSPDRKFAFDAGGFYRAKVLPLLVGSRIEDYNARFGTAYRSFAEIPFPATAPAVGAEPWHYFVSRLLRTDFVEFTEAGRARLAASALPREEFIRTIAEAGDLEVVTADTMFRTWAEARGVPEARIPQLALDRLAFAQEKSFWRRMLPTLNYRYVWDEISGHGGAILNTVILIVLSMGGALLVNPLAAYALSRYKLKATYQILLFCLATIAFPAEVTLIPVFLQLKELHLLNTFGALVLPGLANGFSIFLLKGFFDSLPRELYEAAEIDGASEWTTFWNITMTLSKPILAVLALEAFVSAYGMFFFALILAPDPKIWTIMVYVYQLRQGVASPVVYASLILTAIPTLIVFVTCQKMILRGLVVPSEK